MLRIQHNNNHKQNTLLTTINLKQPWSWFLKQSWMCFSFSLSLSLLYLTFWKMKWNKNKKWKKKLQILIITAFMSDCRFHQNEKVKELLFKNNQMANNNQTDIKWFTNFSVFLLLLFCLLVEKFDGYEIHNF